MKSWLNLTGDCWDCRSNGATLVQPVFGLSKPLSWLNISLKGSVVRNHDAFSTFCFCCGSHWLMNWLGLQQIWNTVWLLLQRLQDRQQEVDSTSIREAPTTIPDSGISGSEACRDLTLWNADNTRPPGNAKRWREENEPQSSFLFGRMWDLETVRPSWAPLQRWRSRKSHRR